MASWQKRKTFIVPVSSDHGAPMGRSTGPDYLDVTAGRIYLRQILLDQGGYDLGGAYWGHGETLWEALDQDGNGRIFRAASRREAKRQIINDFPGAVFYN